MAEQALKKLEEQLQCAICLDTYTEPKLLQCNHVYCQGCLNKLVFRDRRGRPSLHCPACRLVVSLPSNGVAGLQSAFQVNNLLEIQDSLKLATQPVASLEVDKSEAKESSVCCSEHAGEELKLFCETCQELICFKCAIRSGKHNSHSYDELADALEKCKEDIASSLSPVENQLTAINKALEKLDMRCEEVSEQRATIEANIDDSIRRFHELLEVRRTEIISQLHQITQSKLKGLAVQRDQLETIQVQLNSCIDFMRENLSNTCEAEVLKTKSFLMKQVEQLTITFEPETLKPSTESDMKFLVDTDITSACQNYGKIAVSESVAQSVKPTMKAVLAPLHQASSENRLGKPVDKRWDMKPQEAVAVIDAPVIDCVDQSLLPNASMSFMTGENLESAIVEKLSVAILHAVNFNSEVCQEPIESLDCKLVSEIVDSSIECSVQMIGIGQYEIRYQPTAKGKHYLHVKINGQYILGSPSPVLVKSPVMKLGRLVGSISDIRKPWGVVINQRGEVMVSEQEGHRISVFSPNGWKLRSFGSHGSSLGQLNNPRGLALDSKGNVVVADYKNHRIQKFTIDGKLLKAVGTKGSGPLQFRGPKNIAFNTFNKKLYVIDENNRVQVLTSDFSYCGVFGKVGWGKGQFNDPWGIACDNSGNVYVADSTNSRIQVFSCEGQFLWLFGKRGGGLGQLNFPSDIALDSNSTYFYISERYNHRVSVFDSEGDFVTCFGCFGTSPGEMRYPRGLTVDSSGVVYVCDNNNNRLSLF